MNANTLHEIHKIPCIAINVINTLLTVFIITTIPFQNSACGKNIRLICEGRLLYQPKATHVSVAELKSSDESTKP